MLEWQTLAVEPCVDVDTAGHNASHKIGLQRKFQFSKRSKGSVLIPNSAAIRKTKENKLNDENKKNMLKQPDSAKPALEITTV